MRGCAGWPFTTTGQPAASAEGGVAARGGEGEREVAGAEDRDRAERDHPLADVGARQRLSVRHGRVDTDAEVVTSPYDIGEHAQLTGRATDLAGDASDGEVALLHRGLDDRVLVGLDLGPRSRRGRRRAAGEWWRGTPRTLPPQRWWRLRRRW
ncbi:hypothetical protein [Nocardioides sp. B-3]|uniref:hypothetical protein n=1 Tax=Nocardioides sp. B-3 TaxID=2895565 RepID=UPI0021533923|nr:hypothetical protein [Nocardioides sp. B-3]UUZ61499.1 hypothetical protein LP418_13605 [Nocardioides sp. B-3]